MCGIVGYVGQKSTLDVLLGGLRRLEYRGYDSAGVSIIANGGQLETRKKAISVSATLAGPLTVPQPTEMRTHTTAVPTTNFHSFTTESSRTLLS
jgi:glucosamine--fructose-6-phosphate aminotransferase (isomerizing)